MSRQTSSQVTIDNASRVVALSASSAYLLSAAVAVGVAFGTGSPSAWSDGLRWALYMGAAAAIAMTFGLIFGVPRARAEYAAGATERYSSNSNLEQISDWLTKLLVGAGLVQLSSFPAWAVRAGDYLGAGMSVPNSGAYSVVAVLYGSGVGFLTAYLWTRLRLRSLLEAGDSIAAQASRQIDNVFEDLSRANLKSDQPEAEDQLYRTANEAVSQLRRSRRSEPGRVLWVDDHPENNSALVSALQELNIPVDVVLTTSEAMAQFSNGEYSLVITDLGRSEGGVENEFAGEDLVKQIRASKSRTPIFVYAGVRGVRFRRRLLDAGADLVTNRPTELLSRVVAALVV